MAQSSALRRSPCSLRPTLAAYPADTGAGKSRSRGVGSLDLEHRCGE
jgi:hypothetical protein